LTTAVLLATGGTNDDYATLVTEDARVARKFGMDKESDVDDDD
jgi:hypothetical protein